MPGYREPETHVKVATEDEEKYAEDMLSRSLGGPTAAESAATDDTVIVADGAADGGREGAGKSGDSRTFTVEDVIEQAGFGRFQVVLLVYTGIMWLCDAMEMILLSYIGPAARCTWDLSPTQEGLISSMVFVGVFFGSYSWGLISDHHGRRIGLFATAMTTFFFGIGSAFSPSLPFLLFFRMLVGFGLGGATVMFSLFMEFIPSSRRGFWLVFVELFWTIGSVLEALLAWLVMPTLHWRWLVGISALPFSILLVLYPILPESPRYLLVHGQSSAAVAVLARLARCNGTTLPRGTLVLSTATPSPAPASAPRTSTMGPGRGRNTTGYHLVGVDDGMQLVHEAAALDGGSGPHKEEPTVAAEVPATSPVPLARGWSQHLEQEQLRQPEKVSLSQDHLPVRLPELHSPDRSRRGSPQHRLLPGHKGIEEQPLGGGTLRYQPLAASDDGTVKRPAGHKAGLTRPRKRFEGLVNVVRRCSDSGSAAVGGLHPVTAIRTLLSPPLRWTTVLVWLTFFANSFTYYGLVLLTTQLAVKTVTSNQQLAGEAGGQLGIGGDGGGNPALVVGRCGAGWGTAPGTTECGPDGAPVIDSSEYRDVLISSFSELPGILVAGVLVDWAGRRKTLASLLLVSAVFLLPLFQPRSEAVTTTLLFGARGAIMGAFGVLWAYAPELYPTPIRSTGLGVGNSMARVGGFICPFVAVGLVQSCHRALAVGLFTVIPTLAGLVALLFRTETKGQALLDVLPAEPEGERAATT